MPEVGLVSCRCLTICGAAACKWPLVGHTWLGWLIWSGMALSTLSACVQARRAEQGLRNTGKKSSFQRNCHFDSLPCLLVLLFYPVSSSCGFYRAWRCLAGSCSYFSFTPSLGNSPVQCQNTPMQGRRERGEVYVVHMSHFTVSWWSSAAFKERLLFVVSLGLFVDSSCLCSLQRCWWLMGFAALISTACPAKQNKWQRL